MALDGNHILSKGRVKIGGKINIKTIKELKPMRSITKVCTGKDGKEFSCNQLIL
jgi:hypothetical protein